MARMPFVSEAQRAYMHIHHPELADEFEAATPAGAKLPEHVRKRESDSGEAEAMHAMSGHDRP